MAFLLFTFANNIVLYHINDAFNKAYDNLRNQFKNNFKVTKVGDFLLTSMGRLTPDPYPIAYSYLRSIINKQDQGKSIDQRGFIAFIRNPNNGVEPCELEPDKKTWVINDCNGKAKISERIISLDYHAIIPNAETIQIEQNDDAIGILKKYHSLHSCIVCDNPDYNGNALLESKKENRQRIYDGLDRQTKVLIDKVVCDHSLDNSDPFDIKSIVSNFIAGGEVTELLKLQKELKRYVHVIGDEMITCLLRCFDGTDLLRDFDEYAHLVSIQPELDSEELLFIEDIINESIGKDITIERDSESKNYKLKLGNKDLLNTKREEMELSTGEQNFISLAFELLLARHSNKEYVVLDDPISSFDSVYKNKIAYCIIKFLEGKRQIILTHNTDLVRLLDVQLNNCFNLYVLNNVEDGENGFIPVSGKEKNLLINLHELIKLFQNKNDSLIPFIMNRRQFLMAMIPFMRGYSHISLDINDDFGKLSDIMHGYGTGCVDVVPIYNRLFGYDFGTQENISVSDILNLDCSSLDILDKTEYPLLADTLEQTIIYYHLRMRVEKELVDDFNLQLRGMDTLNQIIQRAFRCRNTDSDFKKKRDFKVFFTSRKTLLNEFNHFEGNMNIFQPAIDITKSALHKEMRDIETKLLEVRAFAGGTK